jgi:signal transduction histidine kinase
VIELLKYKLLFSDYQKSVKNELTNIAIDSSRQMLAFGIVLFINYPLYYIIWTSVGPDSIENLTLRLVGSLFCFPLILNKYWPKSKLHWLTMYWYIAACYCLPFFFTFMLLQNHASTLWLMNCISVLFFVLLLFEVVTSVIILFLGTTIAYLAFIYLSPYPFSYNPGTVNLHSVIVTFAAALVIGGVFSRNKQVIEKFRQQSTMAEIKAKQALINSAAQVSHDIRSPLAALNTVLRNLSTIPEDQRILIRNAVRRINDIANNLLVEYRDESKETVTQKQNVSPELISSLLNSLISEKSAQISEQNIELDLEIGPEAFGLFVLIDPVQFKRMISNLLNNAIEAITEQGEVTVRLEKHQGHARISLQDTGKGMPADVLDKIKQGGTSLNKEGGTGIGISSSLDLIKKCDGHFDMISKVGEGTTVIIDLPISPAPDWFQEQLILTPGITLVIVDDDESIHAIWTSRCQPFVSSITLKHFHHSKALDEYCAKTDLSKNQFLVDFELLGSSETGLELIEKLNLSNRAILVTSRYEEVKVRTHAEKLKVKIIPKNYSPYIPISLASNDKPKLIFLDDDKTLTAAWEAAADYQGIVIKTYNRTADFRKILPTLAKDTPIYIDSNLREAISGEVFAKELYELGFTELYLASGHPKGYFGELPWIKDFVSKEPPF